MLARPTSLSQDLAAGFGRPPLLVAPRANHVKMRSGTTSVGNITVAQDYALDSEIDMLLKDVTRSPEET